MIYCSDTSIAWWIFISLCY